MGAGEAPLVPRGDVDRSVAEDDRQIVRVSADQAAQGSALVQVGAALAGLEQAALVVLLGDVLEVLWR
jgi:hypothetical protein